MLVRIGIPKPSGDLPDLASAIGAPLLLSANSLYSHKKGQFSAWQWRGSTFYGDLAIDSAGFVAMNRYGGYPWSVDDYVEMIMDYVGDNRAGPNITWWAAMDLCCEPKVAPNRDEVRRRVEGTVELYQETVETVRYHRDIEGFRWLTMPMPTLQGWMPDDYLDCAELYANLFEKLKRTRHESMFADHGDEFPDLMGLGSVCQRHLGGPDGLINIFKTVDRILPPNVKLHLFGVKGTVIRELVGHPRIHSVDSMAWDYSATEAAKAAYRATGVNPLKSNPYRADYMHDWYMRQLEALGDERGIAVVERAKPWMDRLLEQDTERAEAKGRVLAPRPRGRR